MPHSALSYGQQLKPTKSVGKRGAPSWLLPAVGIAAGIGGTIYSARSAKAEAEKNRRFQAEMSDTAHRREVRDLMAAGLNPALSANRGASSPSGAVADVPDLGDSASRSVASALAINQARAEIALTKAQADRESATAEFTRMQSGEFGEGTQNRLRALAANTDVSELTAEERRQVLPIAIRRAQAELEATLSSARASKAIARLNELRETGEANLQELEKDLGEAGKAGRYLLELLRLLRR